MEEITRVIREEIEYNGVSVIIPRRECMQTLNRKLKQKSTETMKTDIILSGVGGQGNLVHRYDYRRSCSSFRVELETSRNTWNESARRDVQSNLRLSDAPIASDLIALGNG